MEEIQPTFTRQESLQRTGDNGGNRFLWLLVPVVIAALIGGGIFFFRSRQKSEEIPVLTPTPTPTLLPTSTPTPDVTLTPTPTSKEKSTPTPTKKPTPTPQRVATTAAELKRQAISVQIMNGSGVAGAAQKAADYLATLFYTIAGTGNATNYDFETTVIETKKAADLDLLKADLEGKYEIGTASATLSSTSAYDVLIIVGKK